MSESEPAESGKIRPAVFFDRDGVVNRSPGDGRYVLLPMEFVFNPGIFEAVKAVKDHGYLAIVITSQKGVGKGLMTEADLEAIHGKMQDRLLKETGKSFDAIYAYTETSDCPHRPKPDPEMILTAASEHGIDLTNSWMIGDADRDIQMGMAAGLKGTIRVRGEKPIGISADVTLDSTDQLQVRLVELLHS